MTDTPSLHICTSTTSTQQQHRQDHGTHNQRQTDFVCEREHTTMRTVFFNECGELMTHVAQQNKVHHRVNITSARCVATTLVSILRMALLAYGRVKEKGERAGGHLGELADMQGVLQHLRGARALLRSHLVGPEWDWARIGEFTRRHLR